ncbi:MAG: tetraacyldisaccharide 4'-kinase, partial [Pelovirga sp.]
MINTHKKIAMFGPKGLAEQLCFVLLVPLSLLYGCIIWIRNKAYNLDFFTAYRSAIPVISVGNLAVGGTGKTPCVDWLVKRFQQSGRCPAIVSRGYGGQFSGRVGVVSLGKGVLMGAAEAGDEPVLLARRNPACPVLIGRKRRDVVRYIEETGCADLIILDDGFQHRAVARDIDLDKSLPLRCLPQNTAMVIWPCCPMESEEQTTLKCTGWAGR